MIINFKNYKIRLTDEELNGSIIEKIKTDHIPEYVEDKINETFVKTLYDNFNILPKDNTMDVEGNIEIIDDDNEINSKIPHECNYCAHCDNSDSSVYGIETIYCEKREKFFNNKYIEKLRKEGGCKDFTLWARYLKSEKER